MCAHARGRSSVTSRAVSPTPPPRRGP
jgi:hypothetical protein